MDESGETGEYQTCSFLVQKELHDLHFLGESVRFSL
jgi:hypothetical protein